VWPNLSHATHSLAMWGGAMT